jgi:hypothetical protein
MTSGYYRTSSPVTALPMIMRWISDVPSKIVKLVEVKAVSAGRRSDGQLVVSTNSAPRLPGPRSETKERTATAAGVYKCQWQGRKHAAFAVALLPGSASDRTTA